MKHVSIAGLCYLSVLASLGILGLEYVDTSKRNSNQELCKTMKTKYGKDFSGEYAIINGNLYCKHSLYNSYHRYKLR